MLRLSCKNKNKNEGGNAMLIQIGENSASLTSFDSLASSGHDGDGIPIARISGYRRSPIKLALRFIWLWSSVALKRARLALPTRSRPAL
jgi:hypothetical protein